MVFFAAFLAFSFSPSSFGFFDFFFDFFSTAYSVPYLFSKDNFFLLFLVFFPTSKFSSKSLIRWLQVFRFSSVSQVLSASPQPFHWTKYSVREPPCDNGACPTRLSTIFPM